MTRTLEARAWSLVRSLAALTSGLFISAGCGETDVAESARTSGMLHLHDSAGVAIVENEGPAWRSDRHWRISEFPDVSVGVMEGETAYQLYGVRDAATLSDGSIVVGTGDAQVRIFDSDGIHVLTIGREGDGPGEFKRIAGISVLPGDSIVVFDPAHDRISIFTRDGLLADEIPVDGSLRLEGITALTDGSFVGAQQGPAISIADIAARTDAAGGGTLDRLVLNVIMLPRHGPTGDTVLQLPGEEYFSTIRTVEMPDGRVSFVSTGGGDPIPVPRTAAWHPLSSGSVAGSNDRLSFTLYDHDGVPRRIVRVPSLDLPLDRARLDSLRRARIDAITESGDDPRGMSRRMWESLEIPDILPRFSDIFAAPDGTIWLAPYEPDRTHDAGLEAPQDWLVFDDRGRWLGEVAFPHDFRPFEFGNDWVLGLWTEEYDVEYVQRFRIEKGHPEAAFSTRVLDPRHQPGS